MLALVYSRITTPIKPIRISIHFFPCPTPPPCLRIVVFGLPIDGRKEPAVFDIRRIKPAKIITADDFWVKDTVLNWRLSFRDLFRLINKGTNAAK